MDLVTSSIAISCKCFLAASAFRPVFDWLHYSWMVLVCHCAVFAMQSIICAHAAAESNTEEVQCCLQSGHRQAQSTGRGWCRKCSIICFVCGNHLWIADTNSAVGMLLACKHSHFVVLMSLHVIQTPRQAQDRSVHLSNIVGYISACGCSCSDVTYSMSQMWKVMHA